MAATQGLTVLNVPPASQGQSLPSLGFSSSTAGWFHSNVHLPVRTVQKVLWTSPVSTASMADEDKMVADNVMPSRRQLALGMVAAGVLLGNANLLEEAQGVSSSRRALRGDQIPVSEYKTLPSGLKFYDLVVGGGPEAVRGARVAIHYVAKWKGITFMTSRQGMGVTGGSPIGFDVGASEIGIVLKGLDQGVQGMRVGGQRLLIVPPELAYGKKGVQEIPPGATLEFNVELLSIKADVFGSRVKVVEG